MNQKQIIKIGKVFQKEKKSTDFHIILLGLLPLKLYKSNSRNKIMKVNNTLKKSCKDKPNNHYLEQDCSWVEKDQSFNTLLYYRDHLHLVESGNACQIHINSSPLYHHLHDHYHFYHCHHYHHHIYHHQHLHHHLQHHQNFHNFDHYCYHPHHHHYHQYQYHHHQ